MKYFSETKIQQIKKELLASLKTRFKLNLIALVFYGSVTRGENLPDSDLDVLIILDKFDEKGMSLIISRICGELTRKYFIKVSPYISSKDDFIFGCKNLFPFNLGIYLSYYTIFGDKFIEKCHSYISNAIQEGNLKVYPRSGIFIQR